MPKVHLMGVSKKKKNKTGLYLRHILSRFVEQTESLDPEHTKPEPIWVELPDDATVTVGCLLVIGAQALIP